MGYIEKAKRNEALLFPEYLDDYVESDCPVRLFDAFVDSLNLEQLGFSKAVSETMGRPSYDPRDLLKVLLYGYFYGVRSSRRLARECKCNVELMWLTGLDMLIKIAKVLCVDLNDLVRFEEASINEE